MQIGIFGAGSVGCYIGGMLAEAGEDVVLVGRNGMRERLRGGVALTRFDGMTRTAPPDSFRYRVDPEALSSCDVVLVCVKSDGTGTAARTLAGTLRSDAVIVSLQNGVSNASRLRAELEPRTVLAGMVGFNVAQIGPNRFHCGTGGEVVVEAHPLADALLERLRRADIEANTSSRIEEVQWGKLLINLNNAVNALSGLPLKRQLSQRAYRQVLAASISEALAVLRAAGIRPAKIGKVGPALLPFVLDTPDWLFVRMASSMLRLDDDATSSMAEDLAKGREPEIDWLNGEIVALGRTIGVATPVNARIVDLVKAVFAGKAPRGWDGSGLKDAVLHAETRNGR